MILGVLLGSCLKTASLLSGTKREEFFSQENYHIFLVQNHMDHSMFEDLVKGLTGKIIMDKLIEDFEILQKFLIVRGGFPTVSYEAYVDLEVSIREMTEYDTLGAEQWRIVEIFEKTKYILHP